MKRIISVLGIILAMTPLSVNAQTTNDLLQLYGAEVMTGDLSAYSEYKDAIGDYKNAKKNAELDKQYNAMLETAQEFNKEKINELAKNITKLTNTNIDLSVEIENNILSDRNTLLNKDKRYKSNTASINGLLSKSKAYKLTGIKVIDEASVEDLADAASKVEQNYIQTVDVMELGTIDNLHLPIAGSEYKINSQFGNIVNTTTNEGITYHTGIDINMKEGTSVQSMFNGIVNTTGYGPLGGYYVSISHGNGVISYYCHLDEIRVKVGDEVKQYDEIGLSGKSGKDVIVPHLHLGLYLDANAVDVGILFKGEANE